MPLSRPIDVSPWQVNTTAHPSHTVDFITDLPSFESNMTISVVVDQFSKSCPLIRFSALPTALLVADALFHHVFLYYGFPEDILRPWVEVHLLRVEGFPPEAGSNAHTAIIINMTSPISCHGLSTPKRPSGTPPLDSLRSSVSSIIKLPFAPPMNQTNISVVNDLFRWSDIQIRRAVCQQKYQADRR